MEANMGNTNPKHQGTEEPEPQGILHNAPNPFSSDAASSDAGLAVRFKSSVEEIAPDNVAPAAPSGSGDAGLGDPAAVTPEQLRELSQSIPKSLQGPYLQERRMTNFAFEPFSLPASRTASHEGGDSGEASRQQTRSSGSVQQSPQLRPKASGMHSPPLTPSGTDQVEADAKVSGHPGDHGRRSPRHGIITPQESTQDAEPSPSSVPKILQRPASSEDVSTRRPKTAEGAQHSTAATHGSHHRKNLFVVGPSSGGASLPVSRETSPSRSAASQYYSRPFTPSGDANDPYAANKRQPQNKIEPRFVFSLKKKKKHTSPESSSTNVPKSPARDKRHSGLFSHHTHHGHHRTEELHEDSSATTHSRQSSMSDLKRFFKVGAHNKVKRTASPALSIRSGTRTPPSSSSRSAVQMPFGDDHGLSSKYGKLGKVLGSGAGGSVRLMKRTEDNTVFAVKEFRPRHSYETEKEYVKKLTAEYCIGSSLHHGNIIETLDIVQEKNKWYVVMEYAPYDLFAIVMTGKMTRCEIACCFLQILSGVTYLHSMGLAHRDLKLDNVVVSDRGIMKIIDFGSAHVFKYPFENGIVLASGIVGSDPYLAPEVYDERKYDPTAVDIWSLAIIFCCMTLRRFPWKVPRLTDNSFKLFAAEPTPGHDPRKLIVSNANSKSTSALSDTPARDIFVEENHERKPPAATEAPPTTQHHIPAEGEKKEVIRGPWRILRMLPRETRHVIGRMLEINPKDRIKMQEILEDPWVAGTVICRQLEPGKVINADDHTHILEGPTPPPSK